MYELHPRRAKYERFWQRQTAALQRLAPGVLSAQKARADRPLWIDYFPWAVGTIAEKMIFAELARRQVTFFFGAYWGDMPFTEDKYEHYRPDFILPEYRIVIEVYGAYWHTMEESRRRDAKKATLYEASGYHYYQLWDYEIFASPEEALNRIPELVHPTLRTGRIYVSDRPFDPSASLRAQRRRGPRVVRLRVKRRRGAIPPIGKPYAPRLRPPKRLHTGRYAGFEGLEQEYLEEIRAYGAEWQAYMNTLAGYFTGPGAAARQEAYRERYRYYLRWRDWWSRWQVAMETSQEYRDWIAELGAYFAQYPSARWIHLTEYYRWLSWRRMGYRRI